MLMEVDDTVGENVYRSNLYVSGRIEGRSPNAQETVLARLLAGLVREVSRRAEPRSERLQADRGSALPRQGRAPLRTRPPTATGPRAQGGSTSGRSKCRDRPEAQSAGRTDDAASITQLGMEIPIMRQVAMATVMLLGVLADVHTCVGQPFPSAGSPNPAMTGAPSPVRPGLSLRPGLLRRPAAVLRRPGLLRRLRTLRCRREARLAP